MLSTPIIETGFTSEQDFDGIDIIRAIQSFDPCMTCKAHLVLNGGAQVLEREVTTDEP